MWEKGANMEVKFLDKAINTANYCLNHLLWSREWIPTALKMDHPLETITVYEDPINGVDVDLRLTPLNTYRLILVCYTVDRSQDGFGYSTNMFTIQNGEVTFRDPEETIAMRCMNRLRWEIESWPTKKTPDERISRVSEVTNGEIQLIKDGDYYRFVIKEGDEEKFSSPFYFTAK